MSKQKKTYAVGGASAVQQAEERSPLLAQKIIFMVVLVLIAALVLTATIIYANYTEPELSEKSNVAETIPTSSATIRNGGFDYVTPSSENKIGYPFVAANWTLTRESNTKTIAGVVPVSEDTWSTVSDQLSALGADVENPGEPENSVKNDDENKHNVYMLYNIDDTYSNLKNYTSFSAASKSYNKVTIWVKTIDVDQSNVYIWLKKSSSSTTPELSFTDVVTNGEWTEYSFYIEGSSSSSTALYVEVGLGRDTDADFDNASGIVFIDDIVMSNVSKGEYLKMKNDETLTNIKTVSFMAEEDNENIVSMNPDSVFSIITGQNYIDENVDENGDPALFPFAVDNLDEPNVYKLVNDGSVKSVGGKLINPFTVAAPSVNDHYKLSFYVRTKDVRIDQGANIYLYVDEEKYNTSYTTYFSKVRTTTEIADDNLNGWVQYTFYVKPSNVKDFTLQLEIWFGNMINGENITEPVTGTMYITDIELTKISLSTYSSASTDSYTKKTDLSSSTFTPSTTNTLTNGSFETLPTNISSSSYPYPVSDWTAAEQYTVYDGEAGTFNNDVQFGIVSRFNANNADLGLNDETDFLFPGSKDIISQLYIRNIKEGGTAFGMRSGKISLSANTYYRISVLAKEIDGGKAYVYITGDLNMSNHGVSPDGQIFTPVTELDYGNGFVQYNFYIAVGEVTKTVYIELYNGEKTDSDNDNTVKANGIVVFDIADYETLTEDQFKALTTADPDDESYIPPFEAYEPEGDIFSMPSKFENVEGLDLTNEKAVTRPEDPTDEGDDDYDNEGDPINWLNIMVAISTILLVAAVIVAIVVTIRRKRIKKAQELQAQEEQQLTGNKKKN